MVESRDRIYGRFLANKVNDYVSRTIIPENISWWKDTFRVALNMYSFRKRREEEIPHEGCKYWLGEVTSLDFNNPIDYALFVMGDLDQMFQKDRARRVYDSLVKFL